MNTALIVWTSIAVITAVVFIVSLARELNKKSRLHKAPAHHHRHIVTIGEEWEEFYVPGDPIHHSDYDYDINPIDDL